MLAISGDYIGGKSLGEMLVQRTTVHARGMPAAVVLHFRLEMPSQFVAYPWRILGVS